MQIKLKPIAGYVTKDPETGIQLPEEGALVELTTFWERRIREGVVVKISDQPTAPADETNSGQGETPAVTNQKPAKGKKK